MSMSSRSSSISARSGFSETNTLDLLLSRIGPGWFHTQLLVACGLGFSAAAVEVVMTGFLFTELRSEWELSEYELSAIPTVASIGSVTGELFWGAVADRAGRRIAFILTVVIVATFGALSAVAPNLPVLIVMRAMTSFGLGGNVAVDFALFSEFLPTEKRGDMLFRMHAFWPMGQLMCCSLAYLIIPQYGWRTFVVACAVPSAMVTLLRPFTPESPRWLLLRGRKEDALQVCRTIAIANGKSLSDLGIAEGMRFELNLEDAISETRSLLDHDDKKGPIFSQAITRTIIGTLSFAVGLNVVGYAMLSFMPTLLQQKGIQLKRGYLFMILSALCQMPGIILASVISPICGRLLPLRTVLLFVAAALATFAFATDEAGVLICACVGSMSLEVGWAVFHTYMTEVFPTEIRAFAIGATAAAATISTSAVPFIAAFIFTRSGHNLVTTIGFFVFIAVAASTMTWFTLTIETWDRDLEDRGP
eukprot:TRINITY_DN11248_c0_g1_i1.p1 TRINITY_DN11248_c0_g1~~TRINITY_DN11248_c0_g1_i1.p1  ORF type:complete len:476 (+),score=74.76 TRINITY_DN11248_c0_g1_i1:105-1532(+)